MGLQYRAFDEIIDFLVSSPRAEDVIAFRPSKQAQGRMEELLDRKRDGMLTDEEQHELDYFMVIEHLMRIAKARARRRLAA